VGAVPDPLADDWELDQQLEHIERVLSSGEAGSRRSHPAAGHSTDRRLAAPRLDSSHPTPAACHLPLAGRPARHAERAPSASFSTLAAVTWIALSLGTMAFACGAVLVGWSLMAGREELWTLGLPIALGGQIALLVGLVLQLDRLWHDGRHAAAKLDDVDQQLHELKATTTLLGASHSSPASAFYSHLSYGASPQLLLSDLKGQLDLLALKIGQEEGRARMKHQ
jgi:hypothetical protein